MLSIVSSPKKFGQSASLKSIVFPLAGASCDAPVLRPGSNRQLKMIFEDQLKVMVYFHLKDFKSGRHLLQDLEEGEFAKEFIAPSGGIGKSTFFYSLNERGLSHDLFDQWQANDIHFVCRIKGNTKKLVSKSFASKPEATSFMMP